MASRFWPTRDTDLAKRFNITLLGFVKEESFNIYNNIDRIIIKN